MDVPVKNLHEDDLAALVVDCRDFALSNGLVMRSVAQPADPSMCIHAPFTLFPSFYSREMFEQGVDAQIAFNKLYHRVSLDHDFLESSLRCTIKWDDFSARLWNIYKESRTNKAQEIQLELTRSDYFCAKSSSHSGLELKQIEFNTIAASFSSLSRQASLLHVYSGRKLGLDVANMPLNEGNDVLALGFVEAWKAYGNPSAVIVFLIDEPQNNRNTYDQRQLEYAILRINSDIVIRRYTFNEMVKHGCLHAQHKYVIKNEEVAIFYLRVGYSPHQYPSEKEWAVRLDIERSAAIKCPSINFHLAGTKKVQQCLTEPGTLERFDLSKQESDLVLRTFVNIYSLDEGESGDEANSRALKNPDRYVLKPQREGGDNNYFGRELLEKLSHVKSIRERSSYILMDKISPVVVENVPIVANESSAALVPMISELGIYGIYVGSKEQEIVNTRSSFLLRTKLANSNEGGVASGYSCLDSPYLI